MTDTTVDTIETLHGERKSRPLRVVIPGGQGQLGRIIARHYFNRGDAVTVLSRQPGAAPWETFRWDGASAGAWVSQLEDADVVLNLSGRSVNCRYTEANRRAILESRVRSTQVLGETIARMERPPRLWINASTATIYRHSLDQAMDETSGELGGREAAVPRAWHFSIDVATRWEKAFFKSRTPHTRKIALRAAMVMSPESGGTFDLLLRLVRFGLGGRAGSGKQFVSWIHEDDFLRAIEYLVDREDFDGVVNIASPSPLPNREFMQGLREAWGRADRSAGSEVDAGNRRIFPGNRNRANPEKPSRGSRPAAAARFSL